MEATDYNISGNQGVKPRPACPICGATFMDRRGLNGHMAGKHGSKYGINATVDSLVKEVHELSQKIDKLAEIVAKNEVCNLSNKIDNLIDEIKESQILDQMRPELGDKLVDKPYASHLDTKAKRKLTEDTKDSGSNQHVDGTQLKFE